MSIPCRGKIVSNTSGKIVDDLFFSIGAGDVEIFESLPRKIIRTTYEPGSSLHFEASRSKQDRSASGRCPLHPEREDVYRYQHVVAGVTSYYADGELMGGHFDAYIYVGPRTQQALLESNVPGLRFATCDLICMDRLPFDPESIRVLCFDGRQCNRSLAVVPAEENCCSQCGFAPIVCSTCDHVDYCCPQCDHKVVGIAESAPGELLKELDYPVHGQVLDLSAWDGNEFIGGGNTIVSGRVVDILLSINPTQFAAQSLRCYVGDRDVAEYDYLHSKVCREGDPERGVSRDR